MAKTLFGGNSSSFQDINKLEILIKVARFYLSTKQQKFKNGFTLAVTCSMPVLVVACFVVFLVVASLQFQVILSQARVISAWI